MLTGTISPAGVATGIPSFDPEIGPINAGARAGLGLGLGLAFGPLGGAASTLATSYGPISRRKEERRLGNAAKTVVDELRSKG